MSGKLAVFEGLDVSGKSTIAKTIGKQEGWVYYKTPPPAFFDRCLQMNTDGKPSYSEQRMQLFMESLQFASRKIKALLAKDISVACDRWVWTTLSYHLAFNDNLRSQALNNWQSYIPQNMVRPDFSFLITVKDQAEWQKRVCARPILTAHDRMITNNRKKRELVMHLYQRFNPGFIVLDNSGTLADTLNLVSNSLN